MSSKTLTFTATRAGVTNTEQVILSEPMLTNTHGLPRVEISIVVDEIDHDEIATSVTVHGYDDINELAYTLVRLGHQLGHDLGNTCQINGHPHELPNAVKEALRSLINDKREVIRREH